MNQYLLCTDLDRTLIPNGKQPESPAARERLKRLVEREEISLAYVSGRHLALVEQAIADFDLPRPDFVIADVGSAIYQINSNGWQQWCEWDVRLELDWSDFARNQIYMLLGVFSMLRLQEKEKQGRYKLSFYAPFETDSRKLLGEIEMRLKQSGIKANLIWSVDEDNHLGLLDILPASANKLHAIEFLMQRGGYTLQNTVFAGDSGNDLDVLVSRIPAVLVANAKASVKHQASAGADTKALYVAKGGYLGMNGNYSAGILEGLAHYLPEIDAWLRQPD